jgi:hypothetical protein
MIDKMLFYIYIALSHNFKLYILPYLSICLCICASLSLSLCVYICVCVCVCVCVSDLVKLHANDFVERLMHEFIA